MNLDDAKEQLIDRVDDKPEEVRQTTMKMLLPAIKTIQVRGKDASAEKEVYQNLKDAEGEPERIKEILQDWTDKRDI